MTILLFDSEIIWYKESFSCSILDHDE